MRGRPMSAKMAAPAKAKTALDRVETIGAWRTTCWPTACFALRRGWPSWPALDSVATITDRRWAISGRALFGWILVPR
jgi:hypothetical protein